MALSPQTLEAVNLVAVDLIDRYGQFNPLDLNQSELGRLGPDAELARMQLNHTFGGEDPLDLSKHLQIAQAVTGIGLDRLPMEVTSITFQGDRVKNHDPEWEITALNAEFALSARYNFLPYMGTAGELESADVGNMRHPQDRLSQIVTTRTVETPRCAGFVAVLLSAVSEDLSIAHLSRR